MKPLPRALSGIILLIVVACNGGPADAPVEMPTFAPVPAATAAPLKPSPVARATVAPAAGTATPEHTSTPTAHLQKPTPVARASVAPVPVTPVSVTAIPEPTSTPTAAPPKPSPVARATVAPVQVTPISVAATPEPTSTLTAVPPKPTPAARASVVPVSVTPVSVAATPEPTSTPTPTPFPPDTPTPMPTPTPAHTPTPSPTPGPSPDREALVALYEFTGGADWRNNENWLSAKPVSEWYGVRTDATNRVISLNLGSNNFRGLLPPAIGDLSNLLSLDLSGNRLTGEIPPELGDLVNLESVYVAWNFWKGCIPYGLSNVEQNDVHVLRRPSSCSGELVLDVDGEPLIHNDNLFVMPFTEDHVIGEGAFDFPTRFYEYFNDEFDILIFIHNFYFLERQCSDWFISASNDVQGIGKKITVHPISSRLHGFVGLCAYDGISKGPLLHEIMHRWANFILPPYKHWGFSSANGQLGGFDIATLVDHGDGRYSATVPELPDNWTTRDFATGGYATNWIPYSPIELYLAGFIPPEEVPDIWVGEGGTWLRNERGSIVRDEHGARLFTVNRVRNYTIEHIIGEHGARIPDSSVSQKEFRAAAILVVYENQPALKWQIDQVSDHVKWFSNPSVDGDENSYNFYEATGGRATITMDGLSQFQKR